MSYKLSGIILVGCFTSLFAQSVISTVAGNTVLLQGEGGQATSAALGEIRSVAIDPAGNLFAAARSFDLVLKISSGGILTVAAGNGISGFSGDGGPALRASLNGVTSVASDNKGNLYIADSSNFRVRRIDLSGTITTVAGNGTKGFSGDGGPATAASLNDPTSVAVDGAGNLFIADSKNHRIRKVDASGIITTFAGDGVAGFSGDGGPAIAASLNDPKGVAVDPASNLYVADRFNQRIRKVDLSGTIVTIAGTGTAGFSGDGGPALAATLNQPFGVLADRAGNVYIADDQNQRVRKVRPDGIIGTVAGNGDFGFTGDDRPAVTASLNQPKGLAADAAANLYIADSLNYRIRKVSPEGIVSTAAGGGDLGSLGDDGLGVNATLNGLLDVTVDRLGNVYIADSDNQRVREVSDGIIFTVAGNGVAGFSGDNGPAIAASLTRPGGLALDKAGNLYISDSHNQRVRRVSPKGIITAVAGTGQINFSGDGGQATAAALNIPRGLAFDANGNLHVADSHNNRIRKISPQGIITTLAGAKSGFGGDGGPANRALLNSPWGVTFDTAGNLYFSDSSNHRIRKITPAGIITTVAGDGVARFFGDGGPALQASFDHPAGLAVDPAGNLYIADSNNHRIRKITSSGTITTVAGNGMADFSGDGGLATEAQLNSPSGVAVDAEGDLYIADTQNGRVRVVLVRQTSFEISPDTLTFVAASGSPAMADQNLRLLSLVSGLPFSIKVTTAKGGDWLRASHLSGIMPSSIQIVADPSGLAEGTYEGTIIINAPNANPSTRSVLVKLAVGSPVSPKLGAKPEALSFSLVQGSGLESRVLTVSNEGGGSLAFMASASTTAGGDWLSVTPQSGTASASITSSLTVTANASGLGPGTYSGQVSLRSSTNGDTVAVPATMTVSAVPQAVVLSQTGLTFTAVAAGGIVPPQSFGVLNIGQGTMRWSAFTSTLGGGPNWLSATPSGASDPSLPVASVEVRVNAAGLSTGQYYGQVRVSAPDADNSPQFVSVVLNLLPAGSNPGPVVQPTGLAFTGVAGRGSPGSQDVLVSNLASNPEAFASGQVTLDGKNWFVHQPVNGVIASDHPTRIVVQPDATNLEPGVYRGALTLLVSDGATQTVSILFVVTGGAAGQKLLRVADATCTPTKLLPVFTSLGSQFNVPAVWPNRLEVRAIDDCGQPMVTGSVTATFSSGDPPLSLTSLRDGGWSGTWQARNSQISQVSIAVAAENSEARIRGTAQIAGGLRANVGPPVVDAGAVVGAAGSIYQAPLSPGGLISIFGSRLSEGQSYSAVLPLETQLAETQVIVGGRLVPLVDVSDRRINAVLPFDLPVNTRQQLVVTRGASISVPETVTIAPTQPAIFTKDRTGRGQGEILDTGSRYVEPGNPAKAGDTILIYCSGLGAVDPTVPAGAPLLPASRTVLPVAAAIGGVPADVSFAGLVPDRPGWYVVKAQVPDGIAGDAVPVTLTVGGQVSPAVTMAVQ